MGNYVLYGTELYHFGVKGMKWGVRRKRSDQSSGSRIPFGAKSGPKKPDLPFGAKSGPSKPKLPSIIDRNTTGSANKDYSSKQRKRDQAIYGKGAEKRINKKLNKGHGLQGARHYEVERRERKTKAQKRLRKGAKVATSVMATVGMMYIRDQVFNNGRGTDAVKSGVKKTGRKAVETIIKMRGGTVVGWTD